MDVSELCGELHVVGFEGPELPSEVAARLSQGELGGVILFKRNLPSVTAVHDLTRAIVDIAPDDYPPFIGVDQEGGRVTRLPDPVLRLPSMRSLGALGDAALVRRAAGV